MLIVIPKLRVRTKLSTYPLFAASVVEAGNDTLATRLPLTSTVDNPDGDKIISPLVAAIVFELIVIFPAVKLVKLPTLVKLELTTLEPKVDDDNTIESPILYVFPLAILILSELSQC
jgi:hypothetical protein